MSGNTTGNPASAIPVRSALGSPMGYEQITGLSTAQQLVIPPGSIVALVEAEAQAVRWRDDGTPPTATVGMPIAVGGSMTFFGASQLMGLEFIEQTSGAKLNVSYYK